MYASCLNGGFVDPKNIERVDMNIDYGKDELFEGVYKVKLSSPKTNFIYKYHPFKTSPLYKRHSFIMEG